MGTVCLRPPGAAYQEAERLEQDWEGFRKGAAVLLDNGKLTEIDRVCSRVVFLVESDSEELHSELMELRHMAEALRAGSCRSLPVFCEGFAKMCKSS